MTTDTETSPQPGAPGPNAGRRVVILGALSAIAVATARIYASEGAKLLLVARNADRLERIAGDLRARGAMSVDTAAIDLAGEAENAREHLAGWVATLGGLDHALLFYGYLGDQQAAQTDPDELSRILTVNFTSAAHWSEAIAAHYRKQDRGALVVISSVAGDRGRQSNYAYGAAKGGISLYIQGLAHSLASTGAHATAIKLGFVDTPMTDGMDKSGPLWATPAQVAPVIHKAAEKGGPFHYGPWFWRWIMLIIRSVPAFIMHRTKL